MVGASTALPTRAISSMSSKTRVGNSAAQMFVHDVPPIKASSSRAFLARTCEPWSKSRGVHAHSGMYPGALYVRWWWFFNRSLSSPPAFSGCIFSSTLMSRDNWNGVAGDPCKLVVRGETRRLERRISERKMERRR